MKSESTIKLNIFSGVLLLLVLLTAATEQAYGQSDKRYIRQGNRAYGKNRYSDSEILYRKASDKNKASADAVFNTGDALFRQNKFEEAGKQFAENIQMNEDHDKKAAAMYNLGNSLLKANKLKESIEAYKGSLKMNPASTEAKYNLAYAQDLLKKQEQQQQQQQNKDKQDDKNKDKKDNKDEKDQDNQNKDQQDDKKDQDKDQQQQQQQQSLSKDDAERLLNALANEEKDVQEKVKLAKAAKEKVRTLKNW